MAKVKLEGSDLPIGSMLKFAGSTAPTGWLLVNGLTIGSAASGATALASADAQTLFTMLWNAMPNSVLPIQDSTGTASTRGASAIADFNANKRLPLPSMRGRIPVGRSDMNGTQANMSAAVNGVDGSVMGQTGGAQTVQLNNATMGYHTHTGSLPGNNIGGHSHSSRASDNGGGSGGFIGVNGFYTFNQQNVATTDTYDFSGLSAWHQHPMATSGVGSSGTHDNVMPTKTLNYIVRVS